MRKLIFCALLCLAGSMKLYATDVVGGTHVTLPTFTSKNGASITATAVNGWGMKSAKVDNSNSWTAAFISGNSASTSYISTSTGKFAVTLSGELVPPNGNAGNGPVDFSIKANFDGELYIEAEEKIIVEDAAFVTLYAKMNDQPFIANWSINKVSANNSWTGTSIAEKSSIKIGAKGDWNPRADTYTISVHDPSGNIAPAVIDFKVVKIAEIRFQEKEYAIKMIDSSMPKIELEAVLEPSIDLCNVELRWELLPPEYPDGPSYTKREKILKNLNGNKFDIDFSNEIFGGSFKQLIVRLYINGKGGKSFLFAPNFFVVGAALFGTMRNGFINSLSQYSANIRKMARAIAVQESFGGTHFWDGSSGTKGATSHKRYPLKSRDGGYGVMQLTDSCLLNTKSVWNWQENIKVGIAIISTNYNAANAFLNKGTVTDEMRRLEAYTRYNGGPSAHYYKWENNQWIPFNYIKCPGGAGHIGHGSTHGMPDYNNDGIPDSQNCRPRAELYADQCLTKE